MRDPHPGVPPRFGLVAVLVFLLSIGAPVTATAQDAVYRGMLGVRAGLPLGSSVFVAKVRQPDHDRGLAPHGPYLCGELGAFGVIAGAGRSTAFDGGASMVHLGVLQSWPGGMLGREPGTFVGVETRMMIMLVNAGTGMYMRVAGRNSHAALPVISFGFGF
jgi:hypothetical protein